MARLDSRFRIITNPDLSLSVDMVDAKGRVLLIGCLKYETRAQLERGCQLLREHLEGAILHLPNKGEPLRLRHYRPKTVTKKTKAAQAKRQQKK